MRNPAGLTGENPHAPLRVTAGPARSHARPFHSSPHPTLPPPLSISLPLLSFAIRLASSAPILSQTSLPTLVLLFSYHVRLILSFSISVHIPTRFPPLAITPSMQPSLLPASPYFSLPFSTANLPCSHFHHVHVHTYPTDPPPFTFSDIPCTFSTSTPPITHLTHHHVYIPH